MNDDEMGGTEMGNEGGEGSIVKRTDNKRQGYSLKWPDKQTLHFN